MNRMISFGYGYKDGKLIVVESEAEVVRSVFTEYINGKILKDIADELTVKGVDFFNGKCCWNKNMVCRIIENKKYIGEDGYPEIISFEQYETANAIKENGVTAGNGRIKKICFLRSMWQAVTQKNQV